MSYESQASHSPVWAATTSITLSASSTAAIDLTAYRGKWVRIITDIKAHVKWGDSTVGAAATTDPWFPADSPEQFKIVEGRDHVRAIAAGAGTMHVSVVDV